MKLQVDDLFKMQEELDQYIFQQHQLQREKTLQQRILALLVEVGELANETRCFKFWSLKGASEKQKILEEYVDGIHFFLSIGIDLNMKPSYLSNAHASSDLSSLFLKVYEYVSALQISITQQSYMEAFQKFLQLGEALSFTAEEIRKAYFEKNKINHKRQLEHY